MYGDRDNIVSPREWKTLSDGYPAARTARFKTAGHFIMLDEPRDFMNTLKGFLDEPRPEVR